MKYLDMNSWNRKSLYHFFREYDLPFFNICTELDVTNLYNHIKSADRSFFAASLYCALRAANEIESFRYRIRDDGIVIHEALHAGSTILNEDKSFSFFYFDYCIEFSLFHDRFITSMNDNRSRGGVLDPQDDRDDLIHFSILPWIRFTSISHPRCLPQKDSVPKIVFGKYHRTPNGLTMPISIEVHHALMDGIHVAEFLDLVQKYATNPRDFI